MKWFPGLMKLLLLPPGSLFILAAIGLVVSIRRPRLGRTLVLVALALIFLLSLPACSTLLLRSLETYPALTPDDFVDDASAIVVFTADIYSQAPEYGEDTVGELSLQRLRYGAWLHRATGGVPLLMTGGTLKPAEISLGEASANLLRNEFQVPVRWVESESSNTFENAKFSAEILKREGIRKVYLVTSASHMRRSKISLEAFGIEAIPAPTAFTHRLQWILGDFLPRPESLMESSAALYEWLGLLWYHLAYL